ncbi:hypothetical protein BLNAU_13810 [Blattamonas nauphoetae]|uniref:Uncharacterized protein n=1 Tax=Blattamonas nauphoetae TaxID=2049346 RepID=A0ABQ9XIB4_9EUKA|nr:hypothetical protein BLNAU_13810 [Blattamonas nauphoetae]
MNKTSTNHLRHSQPSPQRNPRLSHTTPHSPQESKRRPRATTATENQTSPSSPRASPKKSRTRPGTRETKHRNLRAQTAPYTQRPRTVADPHRKKRDHVRRTDSIDDLPPNPFRDERIIFKLGAPIHQTGNHTLPAASQAFEHSQKLKFEQSPKRPSRSAKPLPPEHVDVNLVLNEIDAVNPVLAVSPYGKDPRNPRALAKTRGFQPKSVPMPAASIAPFLSKPMKKTREKQRKEGKQKKDKKDNQQNQDSESKEEQSTPQRKLSTQSRMFGRIDEKDWRERIREEVWSACFARIEERIALETGKQNNYHSVLEKAEERKVEYVRAAADKVKKSEQRREEVMSRRRTATELRREEAVKRKKEEEAKKRREERRRKKAGKRVSKREQKRKMKEEDQKTTDNKETKEETKDKDSEQEESEEESESEKEESSSDNEKFGYNEDGDNGGGEEEEKDEAEREGSEGEGEAAEEPDGDDQQPSEDQGEEAEEAENNEMEEEQHFGQAEDPAG